MERDESEAGRSQRREDSNVVPLLRDWLGPPEELVPFGPSARRSQNGSELHGSEEASPGASRPPRPEDFWGESSSEMHDALEAPVPAVAPAPERAGASVAAAPERAGASVATAPETPGTDPGHRAVVHRPWFQNGRRARGPAVLCAAAIAVGGAGVWLARSSTSAPPVRSPSGQAASRALGAARGRRVALAARPSGGVKHVTARSVPARHPATPARHGGDTHRSATYVASTASTASTARRSVSTNASAGVAPLVSGPTARVETQSGTGGQAAGSLPSSGGGSSSSASPSRSSHTSTPAFGATGTLGPGSSPTG